MSESVVDGKGRIVVPQEIREDLKIGEGTVVEIKKGKDEIIIKPARNKKRGLMDFYAIQPRRTGKPKWATTNEIKSIWE